MKISGQFSNARHGAKGDDIRHHHNPSVICSDYSPDQSLELEYVFGGGAN
jgi:hypothetical protein